MTEQTFEVGDRVQHVGTLKTGTVLKVVNAKDVFKLKVKMDEPPIEGTRSTVIWFHAYAFKKEEV